MKHVHILHGCPPDTPEEKDAKTRTYDKHWIPWIREQLLALNVDVATPYMPSPWEPRYEDFKKEFEKAPITEDSILVGHSCGATFLIRWLGEANQKIAKLILVAPWCIRDADNESSKDFYEHPIDTSIGEKVREIIIFTSNNEEEDGKKSVEIIKEKLGGRIIELKDCGHFTKRDMGTEEFPELLKVILA